MIRSSTRLELHRRSHYGQKGRRGIILKREKEVCLTAHFPFTSAVSPPPGREHKPPSPPGPRA